MIDASLKDITDNLDPVFMIHTRVRTHTHTRARAHSHTYPLTDSLTHSPWQFYCLPDNYEVIDASLKDITDNLDPVFVDADISALDTSQKQLRALDNTTYYQGMAVCERRWSLCCLVRVGCLCLLLCLPPVCLVLVSFPTFRPFFLNVVGG